MSVIPFRIRQIDKIAAVSASDWDACANPAQSSGGERFNPFISHAFLHALETTGCVGGRTGWIAAHVLVETPDALFKRADQALYLAKNSGRDRVTASAA